MKKRILSILFVGAMLLGTVGMAQAVPMYYTFEGTINSVYDTAGIIADAGLAVGSSVNYTMLVDFDADGTKTYNDGSLYTYVDNASVDYFYTDYISGSALQEKDGGYYNNPGNYAEYNFGYDSNSTDFGYITGNSDDNFLSFYSLLSIADWVTGTAVNGFNQAFDSTSTGISSYLYADLTLMDISAVPGTAPVPEPATMLLLGSGLVGMFGFRKKKETV